MMTNEQTSKLYTDILRRLGDVRAKQNWLSLAYGTLATLLILFVVVLLASILEGIFSLGTFGRTILFSVSAASIAAAGGWFVVRPLLYSMGVLKSEDNHALASRVGGHFPHIRDRLIDALQMYEERERLQQHYSLSLIDASFSDLYENLQPLNFAEAVSNARVRRMRKIVTYAAAAFILVFVVPPLGFYGSLYRIVNFGTTFAAPVPIQLIVEPGNIDAVRGQNVPITVRTEGSPVEQLSIFTRQQGQLDFDAVALKQNSAGSFQTEISNIKATTEYFAAANDIRSDKFLINVLDRPLIRSLQLKVTSPPYTRIPEKTLDENAGDVTAYPGSKVHLRLLASKELSSAAVEYGDKTVLPLTTSGAEGDAVFTVKKNATYHLALKDKNGLSNLDPVDYTIRQLLDEFPTVEVLVPGKNIDLTEEMIINLHFQIKDDFGFSKLRLAYRLAQSRYEQPSEEFSFTDIPLPGFSQGTLDVFHKWDLGPMHLVPEDAVAYYIEVFDNDVISGPKSGRSETYLIRLPSLEEVFSDVSQSQQQTMESMENVAKEAQQLKKDVESLHREMQKNRDKMDWQQQKKAEQMLQKYEAMKKSLEESAMKLDEAVKKMADNKLLSPETMQKYQDLQKLMEELKSPELQKALKKLQESMKQLTPDEMQRAMEQMKASEDQFRKNLERTIELLKRIAVEQKLDEVIKRTDEMKKQQEALKQQTSKSSSSDQQKRDELAKQQQDLQKQMGDLEKQVSDLTKKMEEFPKEMPAEQMAKAQQSMQKKQTGQKMDKASKQMQSGDMQSAEQQQEESQQDLSELEQEMMDVQKQLQENQTKQIANEMRKQLQNVIELSKNEESLKNDSKNLDPNAQRFRENAEGQNDVMNDLKNVANAMSELAQKTFAVSPEMSKEIGDAMKQMDDAMKNMEARNPGGTSQKQSEAMGSLNQAASMMQGALDAMGQGGQGGMGMSGLLGRLGQMAGQQSGINSGTQQAMGMGAGQGQGQGLTADQQAAYQRLANQQSSVQKSLQELSQEAKNSGEFSKLLGDLDRIEHEMQEIVGDLNQGEVNPETIQKQDRILSRLLDASRSTRERDYEQRRKAESGKNYQRLSPTEIDLATQEGKNKLREEMLKAREGKYSKDYEELIRKYFEQLEKADSKDFR
ncbi:MAG TPA: DUF4175 family protein [Bacteroidota bacterium]|jgi:hypothetical protein|nr:DUF4175 family protein [Bacteroidota bacterium]